MKNILASLRIEEEEESGEKELWEVEIKENLAEQANNFCLVDRDRVVKGSPWTFNNHLLIIVILKEGEDPMEMPLNKANFWVQIQDLLSGLF
ncbi:hypothetical protein J1N35_044805 [Gossypium stocksii]|uniref:DUF4283 domain-containing protein n=1 Tax=Gossypium stocksii TaxID=47602 RepID=A0A9D3ZGF2_9ROSI|nr:hypothetical protein J1N35_044805 [Gossypium stocksii]